MSAERTYFLVPSTGPVREVIDEAVALHGEYQKAVWAFADEFGSKQIYSTTNYDVQVLGLVFDGEIPANWKLNAKKGYATPDGRTKPGKDLAARMHQLPHGVSGARFSAMLDEKVGGTYTSWSDCVAWTVFEKHGEQLVLSVPTACKVSPPGCRELKMSEYWKIREKAGKKSGVNS